MIDAIRIVDEQVFVDPDDVVDPDETQGEARQQHEVVQSLSQSLGELGNLQHATVLCATVCAFQTVNH